MTLTLLSKFAWKWTFVKDIVTLKLSQNWLFANSKFQRNDQYKFHSSHEILNFSMSILK